MRLQAAGLHIGEDDTVDELTQRPLTIVRTDRAAEVLRGDDGGCVDGPRLGEFDAALFENGFTRLPVRLYDVATFPRHLVVGMNSFGGPQTLERHASACVAVRGVAANHVGHGALSELMVVKVGPCGSEEPVARRLREVVVRVVLWEAGASRSAQEAAPARESFPGGASAIRFARRTAISPSKSARLSKFRYTDANRMYATSSSSRSGPRMAKPTSPLGISALPPQRRVSSTRCASRARSSSDTGRPWHALRTPEITFWRLKGSTAPERFATCSWKVSVVEKRMPQSEHWRRRRIDVPSSAERESTTRVSSLRQYGQNTRISPQSQFRCGRTRGQPGGKKPRYVDIRTQ